MPEIKQDTGVTSDWLQFEEDDIGRFSRENCKVPPNTKLLDGEIVQLNGTGQVVSLTTPASAFGIVVLGCAAIPTESEVAVVVRHARVAYPMLLAPKMPVDSDLTAAHGALAAQNILPVRVV